MCSNLLASKMSGSTTSTPRFLYKSLFEESFITDDNLIISFCFAIFNISKFTSSFNVRVITAVVCSKPAFFKTKEEVASPCIFSICRLVEKLRNFS